MYVLVIQSYTQRKNETVQVPSKVSAYQWYLKQQIDPPKSNAVRCESQYRSPNQTSDASKQAPPTPPSTPYSIIHSPSPPIPKSPLLLPHELYAPPPALLLDTHTLFTSQTLPLNMPPHTLFTSRIRNLTPIIRIEDRMCHSIRPLQRDRSCLVSAWCRAGDGVSFPCTAKFELNLLVTFGVGGGWREDIFPVRRVFGNGEAFCIERGCGAGEGICR